MSRIRDLLIKHEGLRLKAYTDTVGKITIGVGRNLTDVGISDIEAYAMLAEDLKRIDFEAYSFPWFIELNTARKDVILSMIFNIGLSGFKNFTKMLQALEAKDYSKAADEMLDSKWAKQVPLRAKELADMMRTGTYFSFT